MRNASGRAARREARTEHDTADGEDQQDLVRGLAGRVEHERAGPPPERGHRGPDHERRVPSTVLDVAGRRAPVPPHQHRSRRGNQQHVQQPGHDDGARDQSHCAYASSDAMMTVTAVPVLAFSYSRRVSAARTCDCRRRSLRRGRMRRLAREGAAGLCGVSARRVAAGGARPIAMGPPGGKPVPKNLFNRTRLQAPNAVTLSRNSADNFLRSHERFPIRASRLGAQGTDALSEWRLPRKSPIARTRTGQLLSWSQRFDNSNGTLPMDRQVRRAGLAHAARGTQEQLSTTAEKSQITR